MSRWSILLAALVSLDGVWRTTGAVVLLRPSEGDDAADLVKKGKRPPSRLPTKPAGHRG